MGFKDWWQTRKAVAAAERSSLALNTDQGLIELNVPELLGMSDVEGMAYVLQQIQAWNQQCSPEEAATFVARLQASTEAWASEGLTMPYWGNLWILRNLQAELGWEVPTVSQSLVPAG
jgi:hypothetical protein